MLIGNIIASLGLFLSYFIEDEYQLLVTFGIIQGIGIGMATTPNLSIISQYFLKHRAKANGVALAGCCVGSAIFPPLLEYLFEEFDLRGGLLILSGIYMHTVVASSLIRDPPVDATKRQNVEEESGVNTMEKSSMLDVHESSESPVNQLQTTKQIVLYSLKSRIFYAIVFSAQTTSFAMVAFHAILPAHAINVGISLHQAPYLISIASVADLFGRLAIGFIMDKKIVEVSTSYAISFILAAIVVSLIGILRSPSFVQMMIISATYSIFYGCCQVHFAVVVSHYMSPSCVPFALSSFAVIAVIPIILSAPISTFLFNTYGSYAGIFILISVFFAVPSIGWLSFSIVNWKRRTTTS